jgi:hypothetical protein
VTGADTWPVSKGRMFFFEKKPKNFCILARALRLARTTGDKSFLLLFSKKKSFFPSPYSTL